MSLAISIRITGEETVVGIMIDENKSLMQKLLFPRPATFGQIIYIGNIEPPNRGFAAINAMKVLSDDQAYIFNGFHGFIYVVSFNSKTYSTYDALVYTLDDKAKWLTGLAKSANVVYAPVFRSKSIKIFETIFKFCTNSRR